MRLSLKTQKTIYLAVGTAMIVFEMVKQLVLTFYVGKGQYQWFYFPFQLCSIPMYVSMTCGITKKNRVYDACTGFLSTFGLLGGICAFLDTSGFHYSVEALTVYSYVWHVLLILLGLFSAFVRNNKSFFPGFIIFAAASLMAEAVNIIVTTCIGAEINMFYINLLVPTYQMAVRDAAERIGNTPAILLYWMSIVSGAYIINAAEAHIKRN